MVAWLVATCCLGAVWLVVGAGSGRCQGRCGRRDRVELAVHHRHAGLRTRERACGTLASLPVQQRRAVVAAAVRDVTGDGAKELFMTLDLCAFSQVLLVDRSVGGGAGDPPCAPGRHRTRCQTLTSRSQLSQPRPQPPSSSRYTSTLSHTPDSTSGSHGTQSPVRTVRRSAADGSGVRAVAWSGRRGIHSARYATAGLRCRLRCPQSARAGRDAMPVDWGLC